MSANNDTTPAEKASQEALSSLLFTIDQRRCFRFEAGAGAGKTYSLIKALKHVIAKGEKMLHSGQRVACITYTNVAKDEIVERTDNSPTVYADTIHAFAWSMINGLQKQMREFVPNINEKWNARIEEAGGKLKQTVKYDLGYPKATKDEIYLHHDDVIRLFSHFLHTPKFIQLLRSRFPIIFIDEYQDTNDGLANSIVDTIVTKPSCGILVGFFGDHWQKIYGSNSCGLIEADYEYLEVIEKNANFRSDKKIVEALNNIRPKLRQHESDANSKGQIDVFHSNRWIGVRRNEGHWRGDLPQEDAHEYLSKVKQHLTECNQWDFKTDNTKILMLTNNLLAEEQGYKNLIGAFSNTEDYLKRNDPYMAFLIDFLEPICQFYQQKKFGEMFKLMNKNRIHVNSQADKIRVKQNLDNLIACKENGTIGEVLDLLTLTKTPRLPDAIESSEREFKEQLQAMSDGNTEIELSHRVKTIRNTKYSELVALMEFIHDKTPFSTKHGVKGAEFDNVLVVCGRGWNQYNWNQFLEWSDAPVPLDKRESYERNRNLFYVACSRAKKHLAILFTQELSSTAIKNLEIWFGTSNIHDVTKL